jgi:signal transduction histidine kinase
VRDYEVKTSSSVLVECDVHGLVVPARTKITVCRVLQESLANAYRHARGSGCRVKVHADRDSLTVEVRDEGPGLAADYARKGRLGLVGMRERVEIAGGTLAVESAPGRGALVRAVLPLGAQEDDNG